MADSIAKQILDALVARCQNITIANGYNTNAGQRVFLGRRSFMSRESFPSVCVIRGTDSVKERTVERVKLLLPVTVEGLLAQDTTDVGSDEEELLADLKQAVLTTDIRLGGLAIKTEYVGSGLLQRDDAATYIGVELTLEVTYIEFLGDPYNGG